MEKIINGVLTSAFERGWWGRNDEGKCFLRQLHIPCHIPFDVPQYLLGNTVSVEIPDKQVFISYKKFDFRIEFSMSVDGRKCKRYLYYEWGREDLNMIIELESYAIGECTRNMLKGKQLQI